MAQGDYLQGASATVGSGREIALTLAGIVPVEDSFMVAVVCANAAGNVIEPATDWIELDRRTGGGASQYSAVYVKRCRPHENLNKRYVWRLSTGTAQRMVAAMAVYEGSIGEIDVISADVQDTDASLTANTVTTAGANERVVYLGTTRGSGSSLDVDTVPPAEVTQRQDQGSTGTTRISAFIGDELAASAGPTTARTFTMTNNVQSTMWTLALSNVLPADGGPASEPLTLTPPPDFSGATTLSVSAAECDLRTSCQWEPVLDDSTDYVIEFAKPFRRPIQLTGGRNIKMVGWHQIVDEEFRRYHGGPNRRGLTLEDSDTQPSTDRVIHLEGFTQEGVSEGVIFNCPTAAVRIGNWVLDLRGNISTALQGKEQRSSTAAGILEYQGHGWSHVDGAQVTGGFRDLEIENFHVLTPSTALRQDHTSVVGKEAVYKHGHIEAKKSFLLEEGPATDVSTTITSEGTTKYTFAAGTEGWNAAGSGSVSHGTAGADQVNGANSLKVTHPGASAIRQVVAFVNITAEDWSDKSGIAFDAKWIEGGGYMPKIRVDVTEVAGSVQGLEFNWHLGEERLLPTDGSPITVFCEFPDDVMNAVEMVRIVLACDDYELGPHTFAVNNVRTADGYTTRQFDGPTGLYGYGAWAMAFSPGGSGHAKTRVFDVWATRSDELSMQDLDSHRIREWDWDTEAYVLDPLETDADNNDFFYPPPGISGTNVLGPFVQYAPTEAEGKVRNQADTAGAVIQMGAPPAEFVTTEVAGVDYTGAGYTEEVLEEDPGVEPGASEALLNEIPPSPYRMKVIDPAEVEHAASITMKDGRSYRIGPDEASPADVVLGVTFDTERPGGFGPGTLVVPRPDGVTALDGRMFAEGRTYSARDNRTLHEGRVTGVNIGVSEITLELEGWAKHLEDDGTARAIFYDRDMAAWEGASVQRKIDQLSADFSPVDPTTRDDDATPAVITAIQAPWGSTVRPQCEAWYDAGPGLVIAELDYAWKKGGSVDTSGDYRWNAHLSSDRVLTSEDATANLKAAGPDDGTLVATADDRRYAMVRMDASTNNSPIPSNDRNLPIFWTLLGVVGDHGIPLQGSVQEPTTGRGVLVSNVAEYVVATWAPLLNIELGAIENTSFIVPHLSFVEDTTANQMLESLVLLGGNQLVPLDWGVWENRGFFLKTPGSYGRTWRVRRDEGAEPVDDGPDAAELVNGVKILYDDGTGKERSVGPVGSGANFETSELEDGSPQNPANNDGARHWKTYEAGITSQEGAILYGRLILADAREQEWRGAITIRGTAMDEAGHVHPAAFVRAGDRIVVEDDADTTPRLVTTTTYNMEGRSVTASIGAPPDRMEVLLARSGVALLGGTRRRNRRRRRGRG